MNPIALVGPTASGKSAAAMDVARHLRRRGVAVEIVSVDSALVYRGMDIGTAKPSASERAEVPHHGIDLIEPSQSYSVAQFVADARAAIGQIQARGALPLLVGGTMLYLKALREGLDAMPPADAAVRATLDARAAAEGWPALHAELSRVDPVTAARLPSTDAQRIQRALEVWTITGRALSDWHTRQGGQPATIDAGPSAPPGDAVAMISLEPISRAWLHHRIAQRFQAMLEAGFIDEVRHLRLRGDLQPGLTSMRCVGYRQAWEALDAFEARPRREPTARLEDDAGARAPLCDAGIAATRQLAKRQLTWLRSMPDRAVIAADASDAVAQVRAQVDRLVARPGLP